MQMPIKTALLGCGALAEILATRVYPRITESVQVVAAVDTRLERARTVGERLGARAFSTLADAAAEIDLDAVDVRLPHHLHLEGARLAFEQGLPFLIENRWPPRPTTPEQSRRSPNAVRRRAECLRTTPT
jgi:predicted dehydrogenase